MSGEIFDMCHLRMRVGLLQSQLAKALLLLTDVFDAVISNKPLPFFISLCASRFHLPTIRSFWACIFVRRLARVQHANAFASVAASFKLERCGDRFITSKALPHINHAFFALAVAMFQLLALCG